MQDVKSLKASGWREMTAFEQDKLDSVQACPNCPEMIEKAGESYESEGIQYDWHCEKCDTLVIRIYRQEATLCVKWKPNPDLESEAPPPKEPTPAQPVFELQGFQKKKFLRSRGCPICPGMLEGHDETHKRGAVEYSWRCGRCDTRVVQRYEETKITWSPAAEQ